MGSLSGKVILGLLRELTRRFTGRAPKPADLTIALVRPALPIELAQKFRR